MSTTDDFFDALEKRILSGLSGEKLGTMKNFLIDGRDRFLALENKAKANISKAKSKDDNPQLQKALAENERLETEFDKLRQEIERLGFDNNQLRKAGEKEQNSNQVKPINLSKDAIDILHDLADREEFDDPTATPKEVAHMIDLQVANVSHLLNEMEDVGLVERWQDSTGTMKWKIARRGRAILAEMGIISGEMGS